MNKLIHGDCAVELKSIPSDSVHLIITSPPYNVGMEYEMDTKWDDFLAFLKSVWIQCYRVLAPGGRICVNMNNHGKSPRFPSSFHTLNDLIEIGFLYRADIIWNKDASSGAKTAWGSWKSASNPTIRDNHEFIYVLSKESFKRCDCKGRESTISRDDFLKLTNSVWNFNSDKSNKDHPATFPPELPRRLIELYSFKGDVVLDPFNGTGTTCQVAQQLGRQYIGIEKDKNYYDLSVEAQNGE